MGGNEVLDKIQGGLFGAAVGDALGATGECMDKKEIKEKYGKIKTIIGGGWLSLKPGEVTDDTDMMIAVANGIIQNPENPIPAIGEEFLKWYHRNPRGVGRTISLVLSHYRGDWFQTAYKVHLELHGKSSGNGSLMRCLPVVLVYSDQEKMEKITLLQSKMTHYADEAAEACLIYNKIAFRLLNGENLKTSIEKEIMKTRYSSVCFSKEPDCPPDGYVVHTLMWVFYWLWNCHTFEEVVIEAANRGGDSDTIASIAGGLKGLEVGFHHLPQRFTEVLRVKQELKLLSKKLYEVRQRIGYH
jgi:ADP-ribosyl-[dinitrogen reductase] hydrolase